MRPKAPGGSPQPISSTPDNHRALIPYKDPATLNMGRFRCPQRARCLTTTISSQTRAGAGLEAASHVPRSDWQ
jgi:hypothetical protein